MSYSSNVPCYERVWFTEIPDIALQLGLTGNEFYLYVVFLKEADKNGYSCLSTAELAKHVNVSPRLILKLKKKLAEPREELGGKSLVVITSRRDSNQKVLTDLVKVCPIQVGR